MVIWAWQATLMQFMMSPKNYYGDSIRITKRHSGTGWSPFAPSFPRWGGSLLVWRSHEARSAGPDVTLTVDSPGVLGVLEVVTSGLRADTAFLRARF